MPTGIKYLAAVVGVPLIALAIYFGAVIQVYVLAWVLDLIGRIG